MLTAAAILLLSSCSKTSHEPESKEPEAKVYQIALGFNGDLTVGEETPLSSLAPNKTIARSVSATNDLIGIQVRSRAKGSSSSYNPYAYGLFDDISNVSINLLGGYEYSFEATLVKDGKSKIFVSGGFFTPFFRAGNESSYTTVGSNFVITANSYFSGLNSGRTNLTATGTTVYDIPETDRYYGFVPVYEPSASGTLNVAMSRASFGAKFVAAGLTSGRLRISIKNAPDQYIEVTTPNKTIQNIYTFSCVSCAASDNVHSETIPVTVSWLRTDGAVVPIATKDITFKRKTLTTININVADGSLAKAINITEESGDLVNGETVSM